MSYTKTQWNNDTAPAINETNLNKIEQGIYDNDSHIGDLSDLETTANTDLVSAINENVSSIGDLSDLETTTQTDIVSAINEVNAKSEIDNTYGTSQTKGYSQEYQNTHNVVVSATQPTNKSKVWLQHSKNLIDGKFELGSIDTTTGNDVANSNFNRTNYAYVKPNTTYTLNLNSTNSQIVAYYYSSNSFLSFEFTTNSSTYTFTTPNNCIAVRFRISGASVSAYYDIQLEEGSTATSYEPYVQDKEYILNNNNTYEEFTPHNEVYSTTEQRIGTWINGKPLYRRVFESPVLTGEYIFWENITGINVAKIEGWHINTSNNYIQPIGTFRDTNASYTSRLFFDGSNFKVQQGSFYLNGSFIARAIIEYTKTTD